VDLGILGKFVVVVVVVICFGSEYVWCFLCWAQTRGVNRFGRKKKRKKNS
jgi:hypothetical protein